MVRVLCPDGVVWCNARQVGRVAARNPLLAWFGRSGWYSLMERRVWLQSAGAMAQ